MLRETNIFNQNGYGQYIMLSVNVSAHCSNILLSLKSIVPNRFVQTFKSQLLYLYVLLNLAHGFISYSYDTVCLILNLQHKHS